MRRKGVPCEPHPNTAESLVKKGYLVRSLDELESGVVKPELQEVKHVDVLPKVDIVITPKEKPPKKVKPKRNSKKVAKK